MKMGRVRQQNLYLDPSRLAGIFSAGETHVAVRKPQQQKKVHHDDKEPEEPDSGEQ